MRVITTEKKNKTIQSPWFRPEDAAAYVGISRAEFDDRAKNLPHAGKHHLKIYNIKVLDAWLNGDLESIGIFFDPPEGEPKVRRQRIKKPQEARSFINPFKECPKEERIGGEA